jgi:transcriptional regulator with XRE-family HTH domain
LVGILPWLRGPRDSMLDEHYGEWARKGATLSDKSARKEFGLTQEEIVDAIRAGKLQYREGSVHGTPWLRLLRREVEALVRESSGEGHLKSRQVKTELVQIERELRRLKKEVARLEERKAALVAKSERLENFAGLAKLRRVPADRRPRTGG